MRIGPFAVIAAARPVQHGFAEIRPLWRVFPFAGCGIGGCIATLSVGSAEFGIPDSGVFFLDTTFIWNASLGLGYKFRKGFEIAIEGRRVGFIDAVLSNLDSYNAGITLSLGL